MQPTENQEQDVKQAFGLERLESLKSSGLLDLSKTNFLSQNTERNAKKGRNQKGQAGKEEGRKAETAGIRKR